MLHHLFIVDLLCRAYQKKNNAIDIHASTELNFLRTKLSILLNPEMFVNVSIFMLYQRASNHSMINGNQKWNKRTVMMILLQMTRRILEARCNVQNMTSLDAKMTYIKAWQRLADSGTAYFIVTFKDSKKKVLYPSYVGSFVLLPQQSVPLSSSSSSSPLPPPPPPPSSSTTTFAEHKVRMRQIC